MEVLVSFVALGAWECWEVGMGPRTVGIANGMESYDFEEGHEAGTVMLKSQTKNCWEFELGSVHDARAHGYQRAQLLLLVDGDGPDDLPREQSKDDIHQGRVCCGVLLISQGSVSAVLVLSL